jgi:hypothetical protein
VIATVHNVVIGVQVTIPTVVQVDVSRLLSLVQVQQFLVTQGIILVFSGQDEAIYPTIPSMKPQMHLQRQIAICLLFCPFLDLAWQLPIILHSSG